MEALEEIRKGEKEFFEWFYFLSLALILAFGTIATTGTVLKTDKPVVSVVSCSMYPEYHKGDILIVNGKDFSEIQTGDVVIYAVPDRIDFSVEGDDYTLEKNSPHYDDAAETSLGSIKLLDVKKVKVEGSEKTKEAAILSINGEKTTLIEKSTKTISGKAVKTERISSMPIPVVHRVIEKNEDSLQTKGDYNNAQLDFESDIRPFQVHGTTAFKIPRLGVVKILAMDLVGFQGDKPLVIDRYDTCP
jgi:signal peptidase I